MGCIGSRNSITISNDRKYHINDGSNSPHTPCTKNSHLNCNSERMNSTFNKFSSRVLLYKNSTKGNLIVLNVLETDGDSNNSIIERQVIELSRGDIATNTNESNN